MRNRAKCKLCGDIIETLARDDYVDCSCGEITVGGGSHELLCFAKDFSNFLRVDDEGKEIPVKFKQEPVDAVEVREEKNPDAPLTYEQKVEIVDHMLKYYNDLPQSALLSSPNQYDLKAVYLMIKRLL